MEAGLKCVEPRPTFHEESIGKTSKLIASFVFEIGVFVYWFVHLLVSYSIYRVDECGIYSYSMLTCSFFLLRMCRKCRAESAQ